MRNLKPLFAAAVLVYLLCPPTLAQTKPMLESLTKGQVLHGFRTEAVYLDDSDAPLGARFVHARTGFVLDLLRIQSVPQAFVYVKTYPTSDKGEPHTQEHLLLGKGNKGRAVASLEDMSLVSSSAYTEQWRTCYHLHTGAGPDVFFKIFEARMDALLHPDYTDEEIRREVRNFGVAENPSDKSLRLEEKGTVYNEMVSSFERPFSRLWRAMSVDVYGASHPLAFVSGGSPAAIREMTPEDIRRFHREHYFLANMGAVLSFPKDVTLDTALGRIGQTLDRLEPEGTKAPAKVVSERDLPAPSGVPAGSIRVVDYPNENAQAPGPVIMFWPATLEVDTKERMLLDLFLETTVGDATTNLYKIFVDTKTRQMDVGARSVFAGESSDQGTPIYVGLNDVSAANLTEEKIGAIRSKVREEFARIAALDDGSPEVADLNARVLNRVVETRRGLAKFVNSPPGFGFRGSSSGWINQLEELARTGEFRRSVTMKSELAWVEKLLSGRQNVWRTYVAKWKLAETVPIAGAARGNPALIASEEHEREERVATEVGRLKTMYAVANDQDAIRRFRADYDAKSAELDKLSASAPPARFLDSPPMTLDDQLDYQVRSLDGKVPLVASTFDNMTSATTGFAVRLDGVGRDDLVYLCMLPTLLTSVGVIENGKPVSYEEMSERLRKEILALGASFSTNARTGRCEMVVRGSGNTADEAERALSWMRLVSTSPDWRPENLARIRDVVDQTVGGLRRTMQSPEEYWVNDPSRAYWKQDNALLLTTSAFLTRTHFAHRLRWLLKDAGTDADRDAISAYFDAMAAAKGSRGELQALLAAIQGTAPAGAKTPDALVPAFDAYAKVPESQRKTALDAAGDLEQMLPELPDETLASDWAYLCRQMRADLLVPPADVLASFERVRREVLREGNARFFVVGSRDTQKRLEKGINALLGGLAPGASDVASYAKTRTVDARLREHAPDATKPVFVGLVNPNTRGGVFMNSAPGVTYDTTDREALLGYLASKLYAGGGAHGIFMKTWGAGLAYSNGLGGSPGSGRTVYYAERCPELPQTLKFVIGELEKAPRDPALVEYAIAQALGEFRSASSYEGRGEAMANDLVDGIAPDKVRAFRKAVLDLRTSPGLSDALFDRMAGVYKRLFPGWGGADPEGVYYVVGPDKQFELYEGYLKSTVSPDAKLYRLYPRDYWLVSGS